MGPLQILTQLNLKMLPQLPHTMSYKTIDLF